MADEILCKRRAAGRGADVEGGAAVRSIAVLRGVPAGRCTGAMVTVNRGLASSAKAHGSHEQAFRCRAPWLKSQGYIRAGSREFDDPRGGPTVILTKKIRFGARLRSGKEGRYRSRGRRGGVIISC